MRQTITISITSGMRKRVPRTNLYEKKVKTKWIVVQGHAGRIPNDFGDAPKDRRPHIEPLLCTKALVYMYKTRDCKESGKCDICSQRRDVLEDGVLSRAKSECTIGVPSEGDQAVW